MPGRFIISSKGTRPDRLRELGDERPRAVALLDRWLNLG